MSEGKSIREMPLPGICVCRDCKHVLIRRKAAEYGDHISVIEQAFCLYKEPAWESTYAFACKRRKTAR